MITVSGLWVYPIKSCKGISLTETELDAKGFRYDRRFMLVDESGKMLTQRQFSKMALIETAIDGDYLIISAEGFAQISTLLSPTGAAHSQVQVWDDHCLAFDTGEETAAWFSRYMGFSCRLVYMPDETQRTVDVKYNTLGATTTFTDGFPILLISQASLDDLNSRLENPVQMDRFRPNLVIEGVLPFEEDSFSLITIEKYHFSVVKPCSRCVVTTIEQTTAVAGKEPLKTLATYRNFNGKVMFGQNLIHWQHNGKIKVGNSIEISARK